TLMMIVTLAGLPLAVRRMELEGMSAASVQLRENGGLLLAVGLPAAVGLSMLAPQIAGVVVGHEFADVAGALMPWIAVGVFLHGMKAYYVDHAFMLAKRVRGQVIAAGCGALVNVVANLVLIPRFGLHGAAYA